MPLIRAGKITEVATQCQEWLDGSYEADDAVAVGHVMMIVELKRRDPDPSAPRGTAVGAWFALYADDARTWVKRALLHEGLEAMDEAAAQAVFELEDEEPEE